MDSIGSLLKTTREQSGVSIEEASEDLNINVNFLLNIEEGKIGCFKDIFELKEYISSYAERIAKKDAKEETGKIISPYTKKPRKHTNAYYVGIYIVIILLVILAIVWSVKQITVDNHVTSEIGYVKF